MECLEDRSNHAALGSEHPLTTKHSATPLAQNEWEAWRYPGGSKTPHLAEANPKKTRSWHVFCFTTPSIVANFTPAE
jgi:hypothetical protein